MVWRKVAWAAVKVMRRTGVRRRRVGHRVVSAGVGAVVDGRGAFHSAQSGLAEHPVADQVIPAQRQEAPQVVSHRAGHDVGVVPVAVHDGVGLAQGLTPHEQGAVHRGGGRRLEPALPNHGARGRLDEADPLEHPDLALPDLVRLGVRVRVGPGVRARSGLGGHRTRRGGCRPRRPPRRSARWPCEVGLSPTARWQRRRCSPA